MRDLFFLYGPPGSGKTTLGQLLARRLELSFIDLDARIVEAAGRPIPAIFAAEGEPGFRARESECLRQVVAEGSGVVALGGGALLAALNRTMAEEAGVVICLDAPLELLETRLARAPGTRPLVTTSVNAPPAAVPPAELLRRRATHYGSFERRLTVEDVAPDANVDALQALFGAYRVAGMGASYNVRVGGGRLDDLAAFFQVAGWKGRAVVVGDEHTLPLYGPRLVPALARCGIDVKRHAIPAGEAGKTIDTVQMLWRAFLDARIERGDTIIAVGGGVVGDLTGFAAATWLRGVRWVGLPTTLLAMVDSSLGGKTGADLPQGKNLIGAFHSPALVLADTDTLSSLPDVEFRAGLAEVVKHGVIADPDLFDLCAEGFESLRADAEGLFVSRAMAVKIRTIEQDPYEQGQRAALNFGHTIGHGIEKAMHFTWRHGEAVSVGMVAEARLSERLGLAHSGLADLLAGVLQGIGLPVSLPAQVDRAAVLEAIQLDKKRAGGIVRFALPVRIGEVRSGVAVEPALLEEVVG